MKEARFFGGILLLFMAVYLLLFLDSTITVPVAITLTVIGLVLLAVSRRKEQF